jgi:hypothetical protein
VVVLVCHDAESTVLQSSLARSPARQVSSRLAAEPVRRSRAVVERFALCNQQERAWVVATDGRFAQTSAAVRQLEPTDERALVDLALANLVECDCGDRHVDLPSGQCAEVTVEAVESDGELVGCVPAGGRVEHARPLALPEAVRRQGAHVAPITRRDFARDVALFPPGAVHGPGVADQDDAGIRPVRHDHPGAVRVSGQPLQGGRHAGHRPLVLYRKLDAFGISYIA